MLGKIKAFFDSEGTTIDTDKSKSASAEELYIATAVLLVEMASSDQEIAPAEAEAVCSTMHNQLGVPEDDIPELIRVAVASRKEIGKIDDFVKIVNESLDEQQRQLVLAMIWKVVVADGKVDKFEKRFAHQMKNRLQLSDEQLEAAKEMVEQGKV